MNQSVIYIRPLDEIVLSSRTKELLEQISSDHDELLSLGTFSSKINEQLRSEFLPDRISDTLSIEDIRVDARVTRAIMEGQALSEPDKYYEGEVQNAIDASDFTIEQADSGGDLAVSLIREIHRRMMSGIIQNSGALRQTANRITGAKYPTADWIQVPELLDKLCTIVKNAPLDVSPITLAAWAHAAFAKIHPFDDGNGRAGRLIQDFILVHRGYLPVGIPMGFRSDYYAALVEADDGDFNNLIHLVATAESAAIEKTIRIARAPHERMSRIKRLVSLSNLTLKNNQYRQYELWVHKIESIKDEFSRWILDFNKEAEEIHIRIHPSNSISFEKWVEIAQKGWARSAWVMTMTINIKGQNRYSICLYASRHNYGRVIDQQEIPAGMVAIMLTGADESEGGRYDYSGFSDRFIRLREILILENKLIVYRDPAAMSPTQIANLCPSINFGFDPTDQDRWIPEHEVLISDVVEEFLMNILGKLGLIEID